jgi:phosphoribosylformylglycinamidine (FGAM) synthase-like enzyme
VYDRPKAPPPAARAAGTADPAGLPPPPDCGADLLAMLMDPSWVYRQYDHQLFLNTVAGPGGDAAVLLLKAPGLPPSSRGLALSTDGNGRWCAVDPREGTAMTVAESALNVACVGARPVALVNCLNLGNPEHPEVMWQLSEAVDGMAEACLALALPVVGGNVSLYNESGGRDVDPTPIVGVVGIVDRVERRPPGLGLVDGGQLVLVGPTLPALGGSRWARAHGRPGGALPALDLALHARLLDLVRGLAVDGLPAGIHDVSDGGLGVCLAEMAVRSGVGFSVAGVPTHAELFSESPSRVVVCVAGGVHEVLERARAADVPAAVLGRAGGDRLVVDGLVDVALDDAVGAWRGAIPAAVGTPAAI